MHVRDKSSRSVLVTFLPEVGMLRTLTVCSDISGRVVDTDNIVGIVETDTGAEFKPFHVVIVGIVC